MATKLRKDGIPFGVHLRAARLGFSYSRILKCFIRISDSGQRWLVELRPPIAVELNKGGKNHRRLEDADEFVSLSPVLSAIKSVTKSRDLVLDDDGEMC